MVSSRQGARVRKPAQERRAEIIAAAAAIALTHGLERITLRAVADDLDVRPGLISHYFPSAEDLVVEAFATAVTGERDRMAGGREGVAPPEVGGTASLRRLVDFLARPATPEGEELSRLWLNARHLARFSSALAVAIEEQEELDRGELTMLLADCVADGVCDVADPAAACVRIFMAIDGYGAYVNNPVDFPDVAYTGFVQDVAAWTLGMDVERLRAVSS